MLGTSSSFEAVFRYSCVSEFDQKLGFRVRKALPYLAYHGPFFDFVRISPRRGLKDDSPIISFQRYHCSSLSAFLAKVCNSSSSIVRKYDIQA